MKIRTINLLIGFMFGFFAYPALGYAQEKLVFTPPNSAETDAPDSFGKESVESHFRIYYRKDKTTLDPNYLSNDLQIDTILHYLARSPKIDSISITSYSSPEGEFEFNKYLAEKRAETARDFILNNLSPKTKTPKIILNPVYEHWEGLLEEVRANYHLHDRDHVISILEDSTITDAVRKEKLKAIDYMPVWEHLIGNHMSELRLATWICVWVAPEDLPLLASIPAPPLHVPDNAEIIRPSSPPPGPAPSKPAVPAWLAAIPAAFDGYVPALRTNLLYDVASVLNLSAEFPIGEKFSLMVEDTFPWWTWGPNNNKYSIQIQEFGLEPRWWFRKEGHLLGHFVGLYGKSGLYDIQFDKAVCYQGEYWSTGATYGYAMKLGRHLHLEFSASLGYVGMDYRHYQPAEDYGLLFKDKYNVGKIKYFGPTKLAVSLVWPIDIKNFKKNR